jgi:DNA-binding PucR family transcriptional regulator
VKNALRVGVSYSFNRIENFPAHYRQAVAALDISRRLGSVRAAARYEDFQIYDLLNSCGEAELGKYCHPALELLRQYDHRQSSELYDTLRAYADSGGSVKLTADALFIHRNSLMYRLDRIREITGLDINDAHTLYVLKLSFDIDRHLGMGS